MENGVKGTITLLSSLFSVEEAQKAAKRVQDTFSERQKELDRIRSFIADNTNLINLVQKLPDDLSQDIMVPFGKAAFFPGRLIHTNEFLVFLGEGYYADRTAKQTVEILQRREKALESQMESMKAMLLDLQAEAKFFDSTAVEAAEGLVEIREEYIEEPQAVKKVGTSSSGSTSKSSFKVDNVEIVTEDEDARIMARLDELEREELAAAAIEEDAQIVTGLDEHDEEELADSAEDEENIQMVARISELAAASASGMDNNDVDEAHFKHSRPQHSFKDRDIKISTEEHLKNLVEKSREKYISPTSAAQPSGNGLQKDISDLSSFEGLKLQSGAKDDPVRSKISEYTTEQSHTTGRPALHTERKEKVHEVHMPKLKAFTGSIIEHSHGLSSNSSSPSSSTQASKTNPSKPVSRFKMQKGSR